MRESNWRKTGNGVIGNGYVLVHLLQKYAWDEREAICGERNSDDVE